MEFMGKSSDSEDKHTVKHKSDKKTGPAQVPTKGKANQVMVDDTGVKRSSAVSAAVSKVVFALSAMPCLCPCPCPGAFSEPGCLCQGHRNGQVQTC